MSDATSRSWFSRIRPTCPLTWGVVLVAVLLHLFVQIKMSSQEDRLAAFREAGVLEVRQSADHPELTGPFDLWAGEWWRIPMGGLHHLGWLHLAIVVGVAVYLGKRLEPQLHWLTYILFFLGALVVTTLPRWQAGDSVPDWFNGADPITGLSGVLFAEFGLLLFLRQKDRKLLRRFHEGSILFGVVMGLGCLAFSTIGLRFGVDNLAHIVGFFYGLVWGIALFPSSKWIQGVLVGALVGAHALLWPMFQHLMHPVENGRYHWWLAETSDDPAFRRLCYREALKCDPTLQTPWLELSQSELENGQPDAAWKTLLRGLDQHPDLEHSEDLSRRIWSEFTTTEDREIAWQEAEQHKPTLSADWSTRLLTPRQAAVFLMEQGQPISAWTALMRHIRELPRPQSPTDLNPDQAEIWNLTMTIWQQLAAPSEQLAALEIMDDLLDRDRRAWHLALIPNEVLIRHYQQIGELLWAWEAVLHELQDVSAFRDEGKKRAGQIWQELPTKLRRDRARRMVEDIFGMRALDWQIELGILSEAFLERYRLDQSVQLPPLEWSHDVPLELPPLNPDDPTSASGGIGL